MDGVVVRERCSDLCARMQCRYSREVLAMLQPAVPLGLDHSIGLKQIINTIDYQTDTMTDGSEERRR